MSAKKKAKRHAHPHAHPHPHPHEHEHEPEHEHEHEHVGRGEELARGAGKGKILFLDAPSGLAGDMIIAALLDLGVPMRVVEEAVFALPARGFHLHVGVKERSGIVATKFDVHVDGKQPERTWGEIRKMLRKAKLGPGVFARATATFERLAAAEARVHRMPASEVHFHEVGAIDAIVDVVGSAAALDYLDARVVVSPLPMGRGRVRARHGVLPLPAPAVVECLRGFPTYDAGIAFELVTPTGAAIVGASAEPGEATSWPAMRPERTGWGSGTADLADRPNLLRVVLGEAAPLERVARPGGGSHVVLEANVDDMTGELVAHTLEALLEAGALDAWTAPLTMKKGRPGHLLAAIAPAARADEIAGVLMRESTTLGIRRHAVDRVERPRRIVEVETRFGALPIKLGGGPFGPRQAKPEFDACRAAARSHGVPVREVVTAALVALGALTGVEDAGVG